VSEKSTRNDLDYAVESTAARIRAVFRPELRRWPSYTAEERYNSSEPGPKKEIPEQTPAGAAQELIRAMDRQSSELIE
jgi:hypothetical protein